MSHVAKVDVKIKNLDILKKACEKIGLQFKEGQSSYKWFGTWVNDYHGSNAAYKHGIDPKNYGKCDHAVGVTGNSHAYEIGVVKNGDHYDLIYDFYGGQGAAIEKIAGRECSNLVNEYSENVAIAAAETYASNNGWTHSTTKNSDGETVITLRKY